MDDSTSRHARSEGHGGGNDAVPPPGDDAATREWIRHQVGPTRREMLMAWLPWIAAALVVGLLAWAFVKPAPPERIVIAAGPEDGAYYAFAKRYADTFADSKVTLDVRATAGSLENYKLLSTGEADLAIVQGGVKPNGLDGKVEAIASIYYEPVWFFAREPEKPSLFSFANKKIAAGPEGSGTREITTRLMEANGVLESIRLAPLGGRASYDALKAGEVDVAVFVISADSPLVHEMLADREIRLLNWDRAEAYARRFRYLSPVTLPRGAADLARDLPNTDVQLVAPAASLVCKSELHPAIIPLAARAARLAHEHGDLFSEPGKFPSRDYLEWPLDPAARSYFESGPPLLQKYLPFWVAAMVDRLKYLMLPLITLALPLMRVAPPLYVWRIRSRIYRWYRVVQVIDHRVTEMPDRSREEKARDLAVMRVLEKEIAERTVPLSYMNEFYSLRVHVDLLRRRLERELAASGNGHPTEVAAQPTTSEIQAR